VQDDTQNLHCFVFVVMPLGFVTHLVSHWPHHFGHVTFAETIMEAPSSYTPSSTRELQALTLKDKGASLERGDWATSSKPSLPAYTLYEPVLRRMALPRTWKGEAKS